MKIRPNQYFKCFQTYILNVLFPCFGSPKFGIGFFCIALCIGVIIRTGMPWLVDYRFDVGDAAGYLTAAQNLLKYHIYSADMNFPPVPDLYRPPFYSFFIALVTGVFSNSYHSIQLAQLLINLITALLITRIASFFIPKVAPWVFGLMMLSPYEAVYTGAVLSETITTFLLVAGAYAILTIEGLKRWVVGGVLLGFCVLTRDIYLPFIVLTAVSWIVLGNGHKRFRFFEATVLILSAFLIVLPWTLRNYYVAKRLVPVSQGRLGISLWVGTWATNGNFMLGDADNKSICPPEAFRSQFEKNLIDNALAQGMIKADPILRKVAIQRIYDEPLAVLSTYLLRAPRMWLGTRFEIFQLNTKWFPRNSYSWIAVKSLLWGVNSSLMFLGIAGIVMAWYQRNPVLILVLPIFYTAFIYFPLNSYEPRYSQPVYPFVLVFAGIAAARFANRLDWTHQKRESLAR